MAKKEIKITPLMKQYNAIKAKHPDAMLLFRVGDFYETFGEDAIKASEILGIVLTKRGAGSPSEIELAGFPYHSMDTYLPKLVRAGQRVAICEQLEDPKQTKKIVKRGVTELVTPGVSFNEKVLESRQNNFLASVYFDDQCGLALLDISTGEFYVAQGNKEYINKLIFSLEPSEILIGKGQQNQLDADLRSKFFINPIDDWVFTEDYANEKLLRQFETVSLKGFGIDQLSSAIITAGACIHYLDVARQNKLKHISKISRLEVDDFLWLDSFTIRNLEIINSIFPGGKSLLNVLDHTNTPMGSRLLRKWLIMPLKNLEQINQRLNIVDYFVKNERSLALLREHLKAVGDLERINSRIAPGRINPREVLQLARSLKTISEVKTMLLESKEKPLVSLGKNINNCQNIIDKITEYIDDEAPALINKGTVIKMGVNAQLDEYRHITKSGKDYLTELKTLEQEKTGISSLKLGFNNVFGYYLEVTHKHKDKVPEDWIRKQTLTSAERYITPVLKEYEEKILKAESEIQQLEEQIYRNFVLEMLDFIPTIAINASIIGRLDVLLSFAEISLRNNYCKPEMDNSLDFNLKDARHPVIETMLDESDPFVPNDTYLNNSDQRIIILTGPNMSGKSALLRQTALTILMAQVGCFVPCSSAKIGIVDKIYTRVGASDNISLGESTFMVEMIETASILNNLSERSLVLLDEIGRGTSTYDGVSLAWAIAEFLVKNPSKPKTLFATHYHELNELEDKFEGIKNFRVSIKETKNKILFLRKIELGASEHSFGIQVAKMAGIPPTITQRASILLKELEKGRKKEEVKEKLSLAAQSIQLSMFKLDDPLLEELRDQINNLDINSLSPVEALLKLNEIQNMLKN